VRKLLGAAPARVVSTQRSFIRPRRPEFSTQSKSVYTNRICYFCLIFITFIITFQERSNALKLLVGLDAHRLEAKRATLFIRLIPRELNLFQINLIVSLSSRSSTFAFTRFASVT